MNRYAKAMNRTALLVIAPFIGMMAWMFMNTVELRLSDLAFPPAAAEQSLPPESLKASAASELEKAQQTAVHTREAIQKDMALYKKTNEEMASIVKLVSSQALQPLYIYDRNITSKLGTPASTINSDKLRAQLFYLKDKNFNYYALKVQLKSSDAMTMALGQDSYGKSETTLAAVKRYKAVAGVNAGGFADSRGSRYPLSTTIVGGSYVGKFEASYKDLFFVGLSEDNKLIGGKFDSQEQLDAKHPKFGASFVPVLLKNGKAQTIPDKWANSPKRAPRTVIANYKDDQLLFLVVDGYNEAGSSGATLDELQSLLKSFGAVDAYNLDGGGSSSLIFNGKVINNPSDGSLRKLPTNFLFFK